MSRRGLPWVLTVAAVLAITVPAQSSSLPPGGSFVDDDGIVHEGAIEALVATGITRGCGVDPDRFCPSNPVDRATMAAFLFRALDLEEVPPTDAFSDVVGSPFATEIEAIAAAGVTDGCGPGVFCPDRAVTRAEMATFLVRAFGGEGPFDPAPDAFVDDEGSIHEPDIDRIAILGVTRGCAPSRYCPDDPVTRAEMASFLSRVLGLEVSEVPPRPDPVPLPSFTTHHACCEARVTNIHVMADQLDGQVVLPGEVFSMNDRLGPRSEEAGYVPAGILLDGELYCCDHPLNIGGGTSQVATTLYNTVFRNGFEIIDHKPHSRYISRYPLGIEATLGYPWPDVVFRNDTDTPLTIDTAYTNTSITVGLVGSIAGRTVTWDVDGSATFSGGGSVFVSRTVTEIDGTSETEGWSWTYLSG